MKRNNSWYAMWMILAVFLGLRAWAAAAQLPASGLLVYTDHPATYAEACEYASLNVGPAYRTIYRTDGKQLQIANGGLWVAVDYPTGVATHDTQDAANANLQTLQQIVQKYPQFKKQVAVAQAKWQEALKAPALAGVSKAAPATAVSTAYTATAGPSGVILAKQEADAPKTDAETGGITFVSKDGTKYVNASVTSYDAQSLTLSTDSGIEHISLAQLPKELQERYHYDPVKAALAHDAEWTEDYAAAVERAKATNKLILLDFTGSDWCPWCIKMHHDTLDLQAFREYAAKNLVLVEVDFPNKPQSVGLKAQNATLKEKYKASVYPTFVVVDKYGEALATSSGYMEGGPSTFIAWLSKVRKP